jgi:response regulator of citrate/malate metabolism
MFGIVRTKKYSVYVVYSDKFFVGELKRLVRRLHKDFGVTGYCTDIKKAADKIVDEKPDMIIYEWKHGHTWFMDEIRAEGLWDSAFVSIMEYQSGIEARDFFARGGFDCWAEPFYERNIKETLDIFNKKRVNCEELIPHRAEYPPSEEMLDCIRQSKQKSGGST